jgi:RNA polymerase sigma-70 factor (ECF subfamily)
MDGSLTILPNELIHIARAKEEPSAFAVIYEHYFSRVYNYIRYRIKDPDITDDLTADTFEAILTNIKSFHPEKGSFVTWAFAIARNTVNTYLRKQRFRNWFSIDIIKNEASLELEPEQHQLEDEMHTELLVAIEHLSTRDQDLLALKFGAGLSNSEISKLTGLNQNNVNVSIYRAVRRLQGLLNNKD